MILLTGATGMIGQAVLARLLADGLPVRCLVGEPRQLGDARVRVQIALGNLAEPASFRHALRGVTTVVHLAGGARDQSSGSIEERTTIATWRLVRAAEHAGVNRFVFLSALGAHPHHRARLMRAKALAERVLVASPVPTSVVATSLVVGPRDSTLRRVDRLTAALPFAPVLGTGQARFAPVWAGDVAAALTAELARREPGDRRVELAGPQVVTQREMLRLMLGVLARRRRLVSVPESVVEGMLRGATGLLGGGRVTGWDEAELLTTSMLSTDGDSGFRALGVTPRSLADVLPEMALPR